jgi:hypothetical protein
MTTVPGVMVERSLATAALVTAFALLRTYTGFFSSSAG